MQDSPSASPHLPSTPSPSRGYFNHLDIQADNIKLFTLAKSHPLFCKRVDMQPLLEANYKMSSYET